MKQYIYADNAATTKLDIDAFEAMKPFLLEDYANPSQPYMFSMRAKRALKDARKTIAECIGALPEEIYFTSGGTESDNWAVKCFGSAGDVRRVLTSEIEHHAVLNACAHAYGDGTVLLPVDGQGLVSPETLEKAFDFGDTPIASCHRELVSVMMVNNEIGTIEPIKELAAVARSHCAYFHTDAVQAVGHIPIDVRELGVDMLSSSAHKFNGPKGTGFLYVRKGTLLQPFADGGAQENRMRAGTENVAGIVGMAAALRKNCDEMSETAGRLRAMDAEFTAILRGAGVDFIRNGAQERVPGNISISVRGADGEALLHRLDLKGIAVSTGSACDSVNTQLSHVIKAIGVPPEYAGGTIRVSFGRDNAPEDARTAATAIAEIMKR